MVLPLSPSINVIARILAPMALVLVSMAPQGATASPRRCLPAGYACFTKVDCCSGLCLDGQCAERHRFSAGQGFSHLNLDTLECSYQGEPCGSDSECCSGVCALYGNCE